MIFKIEDINRLIEIEKSLHSDFSKNAFFKKCFAIINTKLIGHFKSDYLFHSLYYIEADYALTPIHFEELANDSNKIFTDYIKLAEQAVSMKESQSFTEIILRKNLSGLVLYKSSSFEAIGDVISQNLKSNKYLSSLASKLKVENSDINIIAAKYKLLAKEYRNDFFIHFIRPFASHQHYNGVLLLILKRQLSEEEYIELAYIWTKVLSEPQLFEFSKASKLKLLNTLNQELSHTWNNYFESIKNVVQSDILPPAAEGDMEKLKAVRNALLSKIAAAAKVQKFFTYLNKIGENFQNEAASDVLKKEMAKKSLDLNECITSVLNSLIAFFSPHDKTITAEAMALKIALNKFSQQPNMNAYGNTTAIEIILFNLIKNAVVHSPSDDKKLNIVLTNKGNYRIIEIVNNGIISNEWCNFINDKRAKIDNIEYAFGIRTIKRIMGVEYLKNNNLSMGITARCDFKKSMTTMIFKLPV